MSKAKKLIEALDDPESFDVKGHLMSPLARLVLTNGFKRADRSEGEERYVKKLSDGREAWLRSSLWMMREPPEPLDHENADRGRTWEFLIVSKAHKCAYCNNDRPATKGLCPHCKKSREVKTFPDYKQVAKGTEYTMNALLGAVLQRLATWPAHLPKPGQPGSEKLFR